MSDNNNTEYNDEAIFRQYPQLAQRIAFYAGIWNTNTKKFTIPLEKAIEYGKNIPAAIELEHIRIDNGYLPRLLTPDIVDELLKIIN